jgi:hypothetical protein
VTINCSVGLTPEQLQELTQAAVSGAAGPRQDQIRNLSTQLGVTRDAIETMLRIVGEKGDIPPEQLPRALATVAENYKQLLAQVGQTNPEDPAEEFRKQANAALQAGQFDQANRFLREAAEAQLNAAQAAAREASLAEQKAKLAAARTTAARGDLALTERKHPQAAELFANAAAYVPAEYRTARGIYLERQAVALYRQSDESFDSTALRQSIEKYRQILVLVTRQQTPFDWASVENNLGNALLALGESENDMSLLKEAVTAYRAAAEEFTKDTAPEAWVRIQGNLANAQARLDVHERPRGWHKLWDKLSKLTGAQIAILALMLLAVSWTSVVLLLYWRDPGRLVKWHEKLPEPMLLEEPTKALERLTLGFSVVLAWLAKSLILFLGTSPRSLDAWVRDRIDPARSLLAARTSVRDRRIAVDLPVRIDNVHHNEPWNELRRILSRNAPMAMMISGPGGAGKTTLACQIALRSFGTPEHRALGAGPVLPILVEADISDETARPGGLYPYLAGLLRAAVNEDRPISTALAQALLRKGLALVIVDGFSERSSATRRTFDPQNQGFEISRLIVTSRELDLSGMTVIVRTETIPTGGLFDFIQRYLSELSKLGEGSLPPEDRILDACGDLKRLLDETPCTPLLAAMWANEVAVSPTEAGARPRGVASLMDSYMRRILLPAANGNATLVDRLTRDAAKIAERELGDRYQPGYVTRGAVLDVMRSLDPSDADKRVELLEKSRLLEAPSQYADALHIAPDPVAEHLVARLRAEELGADQRKWRTFLTQLRKQGLPAGFVAALGACSQHEIYGAAIPVLVVRQIKGLQDGGAEAQEAA